MCGPGDEMGKGLRKQDSHVGGLIDAQRLTECSRSVSKEQRFVNVFLLHWLVLVGSSHS